MKTNDLKKGARIKLRNGWLGTIADNKKGNIRMATVEGFHTETGSVYAHDILAVWTQRSVGVEGWEPVEHTAAQKKLRQTVGAFRL